MSKTSQSIKRQHLIAKNLVVDCGYSPQISFDCGISSPLTG